MDIIISNSSSSPIYEQITRQIKEHILQGELKAGDALPSMRVLAKELRISLITTKRAYEELERDGFIETVPGKGCFVSEKNTEFLREEQLRQVEGFLQQAAEAARRCGLSLDELREMLEILYNEG
ncbi:MAG TPA: GntR family transcriptional regulator [Candidatus Gallacutalibacter pullistercoris]|nr:GntR family transcriptional regulator [Candidatus Gallacutalibacter pullistercoris]